MCFDWLIDWLVYPVIYLLILVYLVKGLVTLNSCSCQLQGWSEAYWHWLICNIAVTICCSSFIVDTVELYWPMVAVVLLCLLLSVMSGDRWSPRRCVYVVLRQVPHQRSAGQVSGGAGGTKSRQKSRVRQVHCTQCTSSCSPGSTSSW